MLCAASMVERLDGDPTAAFSIPLLYPWRRRRLYKLMSAFQDGGQRLKQSLVCWISIQILKKNGVREASARARPVLNAERQKSVKDVDSPRWRENKFQLRPREIGFPRSIRGLKGFTLLIGSLFLEPDSHGQEGAAGCCHVSTITLLAGL